MVDTPEKIWANGLGCYGTTGTDGTEYTRSDLVAELAAENERMKREAAEWEAIARAKSEEALTHRREAEAMMSALADHQRATNTVDAHETANVSDKPEGQQEPVAWGDREDDMSAAILDGHPVRSNRHDTYVKAMELVSNRHSKGALVMLVNHLLIQAETRPSEQAVTEATGEWREVETSFPLKGRRRTPAYFPATGETCEVSGPNCDDADGYTWGEATVLWQNDMFVLYGSKGYWPVLHKHEHVLFRPAALKAAMEAGG